MATDGAYTLGIPVSTNKVEDDLPEIEENFQWLKRLFFMLGVHILDDYESNFTYTGSDLTGITVKDGGGTTKATCTLSYSSGKLSTEVWSVDGKTLTYTYTYSGDNLTKVSLNVT